MNNNSLREIRESLMISKTELAQKANISCATIRRIENGMPCRLATQRKIILALGFNISDRNKVFDDDMESFVKDNGGRRLGIDRRQIKYAKHVPEQRNGKRRSGIDRRVKPRRSQ